MRPERNADHIIRQQRIIKFRNREYEDFRDIMSNHIKMNATFQIIQPPVRCSTIISRVCDISLPTDTFYVFSLFRIEQNAVKSFIE